MWFHKKGSNENSNKNQHTFISTKLTSNQPTLMFFFDNILKCKSIYSFNSNALQINIIKSSCFHPVHQESFNSCLVRFL